MEKQIKKGGDVSPYSTYTCKCKLSKGLKALEK